jgi:hypothetical protein
MGRKTPFQSKHEGEYGMKIARRNAADQVDCVQCQVCTFIGRESREGPGVKRKRTENKQLFHFPFRPELFRRHLEQQHTDDWIQYQALNQAGRASSFSNMKEIGGINAFLDKTKVSIEFAIKADIVEKHVCELFFHPVEDEEDEDEDVEPATKHKAMKLFMQQDDGTYLVSVMNPLRFWLRIDLHRWVCHLGRRRLLLPTIAIGPKLQSYPASMTAWLVSSFELLLASACR